MKRALLNKKIKERRRQEILDAATAVFAKSGYHLTDVDEIANKLKIGKGTIYRYFPSKHKLFTAVMEQLMRSYASEMRGGFADTTDPVAFLKSIIKSHLYFFESHLELLEIFVHFRSEYKQESKALYVKHYAQGFQAVENTIKKCVEQGLMKKIDPKSLTSILIDNFYGMLFTTFLEVGKKTFKEKFAHLEDVVINNLLIKKQI